MTLAHCMLPARYPVDRFPGLLKTFLAGIIDHTKTDPAIAGSELLATIAAAVQHCAMVKIPGYDPTPLGLFVQIIATSGGGKSRAANILAREVRGYEDSCSRMYQLQSSDYQNELEEWQDELEALRQVRRKAMRIGGDLIQIREHISVHKLAKPKEPIRRCLLRSDISLHSLIEDLSSDVGSTYVSHDEANEFYRSKLADRLGIFNSAYSGIPLSKDRAHAHSVSMRPRLTLSLRIQPTVLKKLLKGKHEIFVDSGFFNRMLFVGSNVKSDPNSGELREFETFERKEFDRRLRALLESRNVEERVEPELLAFMPEALLEIAEMAKFVAHDISPSGPLAGISGAALRLVENTIRIAAGVKFFLEGPGPISLEYLKFAKAVAVWHLIEFQRLFAPGGGLSQEQADAEKLEEFLRKRTADERFFQRGYVISKRILTTSGPFRGDGGVMRLDEAAGFLQRQGKVLVTPRETFKGSPDFILQLTDRFFGSTTSSAMPAMNPEASDSRFGLRDYSTPCRCLLCRYCGE